MNTLATQPIHLIDSNQGIYIPQSLAGMILRGEIQIESGVIMGDIDFLFQGPDTEGYWDVWDAVERNAVVTYIPNGQRFTLHHDCDLWIVPEGFELEESSFDGR